MKVQTVLEHTTLAIRTSGSPNGQPFVTPGEVAELDLAQRRLGCEWFQLGHRSIKAGGQVGSFAVGKKVYEILPKVDGLEGEGVRDNLHLMMAAGGLLAVDEAGLAPLLRKGQPLLVAYLGLFVRRLATEWRRGALRRYQVLEENTAFLRGRLLLHRHLKENLVHRERFFCSRDEFTVDNPHARLLKAAVQVCARQEFAPDVAVAARALLIELDGVGDDRSGDAPQAVPLERQHQRFAPLLDMARLILAAESPATRTGGPPAFALMFEMFAGIEAFIATELRRALPPPLRVEAQFGKRSLLQREHHGKWTSAFRLVPDVAIHAGAELVCLIDTKWKRLDAGRSWNNVSVADIYQMHAYAAEYSSPRTILVYPRCGGFELHTDNYRRSSPGEGGSQAAQRILVRTVDVSSDLSRPEARSRLREELRTIVEG